MKRSFLKELNLDIEVIDKIMAENGKDIKKYKDEIEEYVSEIKELKSNAMDSAKSIEKAVKEKEKELRNEFSAKEEELKKALEKSEKFDEISKELETLKQENADKEYLQNVEQLFIDNKLDFSSKFAKEGILSKFKDKKFEVKEGKFGEEATKFIKELQESDKDAFKPLQSNNKGEDDTSQGTYHYEPLAIITFYRAQVDKLKEACIKYGLYDAEGKPVDKLDLSIGTVDAFQGREFKVVYLATTYSIGENDMNPFEKCRLNDNNLLCVALSRQENLLIVVGNKDDYRHENAKKYVPSLYEVNRICNGG